MTLRAESRPHLTPGQGMRPQTCGCIELDSADFLNELKAVSRLESSITVSSRLGAWFHSLWPLWWSREGIYLVCFGPTRELV